MSLTGVSANRLELLQIADAVAREKSIEKEIVIEAIEDAIVKGAKARYGSDHDIRARIETDRLVEGRKRFKGRLAGIEDQDILIDLDDEDDTALIPFAWLAEAKLVLNDELMKLGAAKRPAQDLNEED